MDKIFISMGFKGRSDEEVLRRREEIIEIIKNEYSNDIEVIDNFVKSPPEGLEGDKLSVWCLGDSVRMMAESDLVVFDIDYADFRGCTVEKMVVMEYHLHYALIMKNNKMMFFV